MYNGTTYPNGTITVPAITYSYPYWYGYQPMQYGWICARCGASNSPSKMTCGCSTQSTPYPQITWAYGQCATTETPQEKTEKKP